MDKRITIYIAPKSTNESRAHYCLEPAWGIRLSQSRQFPLAFFLHLLQNSTLDNRWHRLVSWNLTSLFSTNMAISETKGQGWKVIHTQ